VTTWEQQIDAAAAVSVTRCQSNPLPFIVPDPDNPHLVLSMWTVTESGDYCSDFVTGITFAEDLLQRSKQLSKQFGTAAVGRLLIAAVLQEIVRKGKVGPIERSFLERIAMAASAASFN
jgi:hypothetical protein